MLNKSRRISRPADFQAIFKTGRRKRVGPLTFIYLYNDIPFRLATIASRKTAKRAVRRNRLRRLVSEAINQQLKLNPALTGDLAILINSDPLDNDYPEIFSAVKEWFASSLSG